MTSIKHKVALVTGASSGIGKDTVKDLLQQDCIVYAAARRTEKMEDLKLLGAIPIKLDITDDHSVAQCVATIQLENKGVDILINNAGYGSYGSVEDTPISEAKRQFEVNIFGLANITQKVLPYMRANKYGKIINIGSIGGKIYTPLGAWYHATKHALEGWSDCLRIEVKDFGIDVIIIQPGGIQSEWGAIAADNALKVSGKTAYKKKAEAAAKSMREVYDKGLASPATVISQLIVKALKTNKPKARYHAGYMANLALFSRWLLSDGLFDWFLKLQLKQITK